VLLTIIEENAWKDFGFDEPSDILIIKSNVRKLVQHSDESI